MPSEDALALLRSIDASLKEILALSRQRTAKAVGNGGAAPVASDRDLDGKYGDPIVKTKDPRDWVGETMKGRHYSECSPLYLDMLADRHDYFAITADKENKLAANGQPVSKYERLAAARARGWAARIRARPGGGSDISEPESTTWAEPEY